MGDADDLAFAIVFGLVAGMMIYVSLLELLPSAYKVGLGPEGPKHRLGACCGCPEDIAAVHREGVRSLLELLLPACKVSCGGYRGASRGRQLCTAWTHADAAAQSSLAAHLSCCPWPQFDHNGKIAPISLVAGMVVMAISLVLFTF